MLQAFDLQRVRAVQTPACLILALLEVRRLLKIDALKKLHIFGLFGNLFRFCFPISEDPCYKPLIYNV